MKTKFKISNVMKWCFKNTWFFFVGIVFLVSCSSNSDVPEPPIGKWDDNIVLSQKTANFSSNTNSVTITTKYTGWWIAGIGWDNNNNIDLTGVNRISQNLIITNTDFQVERKNGNTIIITMNQNTTNSERILYIELQGGDYFDSIIVKQSK